MNNFWKKKVVLITGYEGFLGSHLSKKLLDCNAKIIGLDIKVNRRKTILDRGNYKKIIVIKGSVTDLVLVKKLLKKYNVNIVFHLAAEAIVSKCNKEPLRTFDTNIRGTWSILEACRIYNRVESIIIASSDKAYGDSGDLPYKESTALNGLHPYDSSKSCADLIAQTFANTYNLPVVITRCGNIYGPGDFNFSRIIPDALRCIFDKNTLLIRSDGKSIRDYIYVEDIINGYILLAEKLTQLQLHGEAFNFSANRPITVLNLLNQINKLCKNQVKLKYRILNQARHEIKHQYLSSQKAKRIINWTPKHTLKMGLQKTIPWYFKNYPLLREENT